MKYQIARQEIRDGDVLSFKGTSCFSWLIRKWTGSAVTHVGFAVWFHHRLFVLEAREGRGVRMYPLSQYLKNGKCIEWIALVDDGELNRIPMIKMATWCLGKDYASPWQFIRSFGVVAKWVSDKIGLPADVDRDRFFCSEYVFSVLRQSGLTLRMHGRSPATITPGEIVEMSFLVSEKVPLDY